MLGRILSYKRTVLAASRTKRHADVHVKLLRSKCRNLIFKTRRLACKLCLVLADVILFDERRCVVVLLTRHYRRTYSRKASPWKCHTCKFRKLRIKVSLYLTVNGKVAIRISFTYDSDVGTVIAEHGIVVPVLASRTEEKP